MKGFSTVIVSLMVILILLLTGKEVLRTGGSDVEITYRDLNSIADIKAIELDCAAVKPVVYRSLTSLAWLPVAERKEAFIKIVLPSILIAEQDIKKKRGELLRIKEKVSNGTALKDEEISFLSHLSKEYRTDNLGELLSRLNTHPTSIILAQAALESGWGSSRFFVEANNIFGIWTFRNKSGIKAISSEARLSRYDNVLQSVEDYLYNINVGWAYVNFREMRTVSPRSLKLINYLDNYSTLRGEYVRRLNNIIRSTNLEIYDTCRIDPAYIY